MKAKPRAAGWGLRRLRAVGLAVALLTAMAIMTPATLQSGVAEAAGWYVRVRVYPNNGAAPLPVEVTASIRVPPRCRCGRPQGGGTWTVEYGDGSSDSRVGGIGARFAHVYKAPGTFGVIATYDAPNGRGSFSGIGSVTVFGMPMGEMSITGTPTKNPPIAPVPVKYDMTCPALTWDAQNGPFTWYLYVYWMGPPQTLIKRVAITNSGSGPTTATVTLPIPGNYEAVGVVLDAKDQAICSGMTTNVALPKMQPPPPPPPVDERS